MALRLHLVMLERVEDLWIVRGRDHAVKHAQHVLFHRMCFVDVLDQLFLQLSHLVQPPHSELTELAAEQRRASEVAPVQRLELVDEHAQRVVELPPAHLERQTRQARKLRRSTRPVDALHASMQRRQRPRDALYRPDPVELTHPSRVPPGAWTKRSLSTDGSPARQGASRDRRLAVRAEMGRFPG